MKAGGWRRAGSSERERSKPHGNDPASTLSPSSTNSHQAPHSNFNLPPCPSPFSLLFLIPSSSAHLILSGKKKKTLLSDHLLYCSVLLPSVG